MPVFPVQDFRIKPAPQGTSTWSANRTRRWYPVITEKKQEETGLAAESGAFRKTK